MRGSAKSATAEERRSRFRSWRLLLALVVVTVLGAAVPAFAAQVEPDQPVDSQVVGGEPVPDGKYPFVVALQDLRLGETGLERLLCGGTLIDPEHVLTAAHCMFDYDSQGNPTKKRPLDELRAAIGRTVLNSDQGEVRSISDVSIHPRYENFTYDAAVLRLNRPVDGVKPIKLAPTGSDKLERPGKLARVAGFGNTIRQSPDFSENDRYSNRMQEAQVPLVSDAECGDDYKQGFIPKVMICAGKKGVDSCQGDSGGPLFRATKGETRQIGIVSFGRGCATKGFPGVYTEVNSQSIASFIQQATGRTASAEEPTAAQ